ncbi:MAG: DNA replication and repair protein RecF [bacterium]
MLIKSITLNNFRCFTNKTFDIDGKFVVIKGKNGTGKTSLLEAIHYSCYLRSFRSHLSKDLVNLEKEHFFVRINFDTQEQGGADTVQVGYTAQEGKLVKLNQKPIQSYKELITNYRIYTLTAEDLLLVSGVPDIRREFLNFSLILQNPAVLQELKLYKQILTQRNSLISNNYGNENRVAQELGIWTEKLWQQTRVIQKARCDYLVYLETQVNSLLRTYFNYASQQNVQLEDEFNVSFTYQAKNKSDTQSFERFWADYQHKTDLEFKLSRSLFGAHIDDFAIIFQKKRARVFASRGQQKLITFLIKVAQLQQTLAQNNAGVLLLDDFLTADFDPEKISLCLAILEQLDCQIFITSPINSDNLLKSIDIQKMFLIEL